MRKSCIMTIFALMFACRADEVADERIKHMLILSNSYIDNAHAADRVFNRAVAMCESDSNRLARIFYELSLTNESSLAEQAVMRLGQYGTPAQLPYLYSVVTNEIRGAEAAKAILQIEGVTTNSILAVSNCLSQALISSHDRYVLFCDFADQVYRLATNNSSRVCGLDYIRWLAPRANAFCLVVDEELIKHEPAYRTSKRRLSVLRSVRELGMNDFQLNYITNAINELVAYPEADLPE